MIEIILIATTVIGGLVSAFLLGRAFERLEGVEGQSPASGSGGRSRPENQTPTNSHHSFAVREAKEGVKLQRLLKLMGDRAAAARGVAAIPDPYNKTISVSSRYEYQAADYEEMASMLAAAMGEPLTQSEGNEAQRSGPCFGEFVTELYKELIEAAKEDRATGNMEGAASCLAAAELLKERSQEFMERVTEERKATQ